MSDDYTWSLGVVLGLPALIILLIPGLIVLILSLFPEPGSRYREWPLIVGSAVWVVVLIVGGGVLYWPWKAEYHQWQETSGTIERIEKRLIPSGDGMAERFVVEFTDGRQRACDDTRCALLVPGDELVLMCKRDYQWGATPGYDCNFRSAIHEPA